MKRILGLCVAALLVVGTAGAQTPPVPGAPPPGPGSHLRSLGLSSDQVKRVQDVLHQFGSRMSDLERDLADHRKSLEALFSQYSLDTGQAKQLNKEINSIQRSILDQHLKLQVELRKVLTADQFAKLRAGMERRWPQNRRGAPPWQH